MDFLLIEQFKFEEIDQSTQGSQEVDIQMLIHELNDGAIIRYEGDFIKIAHTTAPGEIMVQDVKDVPRPLNEEYARMLEIIII